MLSIKSIGQELVLHVIENGADADLSIYTDKVMILTKPDGTEITRPASILNPPGSDGRLKIELEGGVLTVGRWTVRALLTIDASHQFYTDAFSFAPGS